MSQVCGRDSRLLRTHLSVSPHSLIFVNRIMGNERGVGRLHCNRPSLKRKLNLVMLIILDLLSAVGFLTSFYFVRVRKEVVRPDHHLIPIFCRMKEGECLTVLNYRQSDFFGVPNYVLGLSLKW